MIALDHAGLVSSLSVLFSTVLVPKAVREELFKRRATKDRLQAIFADYAFLERCDGYDQGAVDILLLEQRRQRGQDRGEAEAVVQASQFGAAVVIDDRWGGNSPSALVWIAAERFGCWGRGPHSGGMRAAENGSASESSLTTHGWFLGAADFRGVMNDN